MPPAFKEQYSSTRVILDATEVQCEASSSLVLQSSTFSSYKSTNTFKGLLGISPDGTVTFVSQLFTGSISDKECVEKSGFLKLPFDDGDSIMADKGFKIEDDLKQINVRLNIPPFLRQGHFTSEEVKETEAIASLRIHVERRIQRIKNFHIFDRPISLSIAPVASEIRQEEITVAHAISIALETWKLGPVAGYPQATSQRVAGRVFETPGLY
ncbi:hypothetical protein HPB47_023062 [Ixodes persulcatus]|uniref:Uncharacterized protein n=1 Tax=Ixodes persulcatus TaxID=34615 RepID=A0AC60Q807_IXOPE|nr:hypothetical protein HPB47_023062 [Ixodes persulcatus]